MADNSSLREQLIGIRDERRMAANTATRIGEALLALMDYAGSGSYIRKDREDSTKYLLRLLAGAVIGNDAIRLQSDGTVMCGDICVSGDSEFGQFLKGLSGGIIDANGDAELGKLVLRDSLVVPQITYNNIEVIAGNTWRTPGGGTILRTAEIGGTFYGMLKLEEGQIGRIAVGDKCQGVWHQGGGKDWASADSDERNGNFHFSGFTTVYFKVEMVYTDASMAEQLAEAFGLTEEETLDGLTRNMFFRYSLRCDYRYVIDGVSKSARVLPADDIRRWTDNTHPQPQMDFAAYANPTDPQRQQCRYETPSYKIQLVGMVDWVYGPNNIEAIYDDLNGFSIIDRNGEVHALSGWGAALGNLYMWGNIEHIDRAPIVTSQRIWAVLASTTDTPQNPDKDKTIGWTKDNIPNVKPTKEKPYLWHIFEYTYDREDSSVEKWSAPWLASTYAAPGADGDQSNLYGYGTEFVGYRHLSSLMHTQNGLIGIAETHADKYFYVDLGIEIPLAKGRKYAISGRMLSPASGTGYVFYRSANGWLESQSFSVSANVWVDFSKVLTYDGADNIKCIGIQVSSIKEAVYDGLFEISNLKIEDVTHINGDSTPYNGLRPDSRPQGQNLLLDTKFDDLEKWAYHNGTKVDNAKSGVPSFVGTNSSGKEYYILAQDVSFKPNTIYTLSYWMKSDGSSIVYLEGFDTPFGVCVYDGAGRAVSSRYASFYPEASNDFKFHTLTFRTPSDVTGVKRVVWRMDGNGSLSVCMPKLEEGDKATPWQLNEDDRIGTSVLAMFNATASDDDAHYGFRATDRYMKTSSDGGKTWNGWMPIVGEKGDGADYTDFAFNISKSQTSIAELGYGQWQDAPVAVTDTYPYLWCRSTLMRWDASGKKYSKGTEKYFVLTAEDGADGADGVQPNLYGYNSVFAFDDVVHTSNGFAVVKKVSSSKSLQIWWRNDDIYKKFQPGMYSLSGRITVSLLSGTSSSYSLGVGIDNGQIKGGQSNYSNCRFGSIVDFAVKLSTTSETTPWIIIYANEDDIVRMTVTDLKFERSDKLVGVSTPYAGLGQDDIPVRPNLLRDTLSFGDATRWRNYNGSKLQNCANGTNGFGLTNNGSAYVEMLEQIITPVLQPNKWYTMSYWAKCSGNCSSFVYPEASADAGISVSYESVDDYAMWNRVNNGWQSNNNGQGSSLSVMKVTIKNTGSIKGKATVHISGSSEAGWDFVYIHDVLLTSVASTTSCLWKYSGESINDDYDIEVAANSTVVRYIGYYKDGSKNDFDDQYKVTISINAINLGMRTVDGFAAVSAPDNSHPIEQSSDWKRHYITFRTKPVLSGEKYLLFRVGVGGSLQVCQVKLEEGEKPTAWQESISDRVGAIARPCGEWQSGSTYVWNSYYRDIVIYNGGYYSVKREGSEVTTIPTNSNDWEKADQFQFVATDLLLANKAYIENLGVRSVVTNPNINTPRIEMEDSTFRIYGTNDTPSIQLAVRNDGVAVLEFYDKDGNKMYDLGPDSILSQSGTVMPTMTKITSLSAVNLYSTLSGLPAAKNLATKTALDYYKFAQGYQWVGNRKGYMPGDTTVPRSDINGMVYDSRALSTSDVNGIPTGSKIASGYYISPLLRKVMSSSSVFVYERRVYYSPTSGVLSSSTNAIYFRKEMEVYVPCDVNGNLKQDWEGKTIKAIWGL